MVLFGSGPDNPVFPRFPMRSRLARFIGDKAFYKSVLTLLIPMLIQQFITSFVSLLDNVMVGSLGKEAISAASIANQVMMVFALAALGLFTVRSARVGRSSFYTIAASASISIFLMQAILNVFGTVDFLPLTGVTFPFVSNGGSSLMCCWGLLAFIKACDTRRNASFAVKLSAKGGEAA
jgi:Na+-driven multidrug efflux pump